MPTFEHTIEIAAPIDQVFAFGNDPANWTRTMPSLTDIEIVDETDDGFLMSCTYRLLGRPLDGEMELTVDEENWQTTTEFDSPGMTGLVELRYVETDGGDGTRVIQSVDYEFGDSLLERVLEPVAKRYNKRQFKQSLELTKELIEAEARATVEA